MRGHRYLEPGFLEGLVEKPANQKTYQAELAGDLNKLKWTGRFDLPRGNVIKDKDITRVKNLIKGPEILLKSEELVD